MCDCLALWRPLQSIMFWVVDSLMMRKYKSLKSLDDNCGSPEKAEGSLWVTDEESRVRTNTDLIDQVVRTWHQVL